MSGPWLLDLFCGAGGAAVGYSWAGFEVVGVDIVPQPHWPLLEGSFVQADALTFLRENGGDFDVIHASPPCQRWSTMTARHGARRPEEHPDYVTPVRELLRSLGKPYIIENVPRAPLENPTMLCGTPFGLGAHVGHEWWELRRHRNFETSFPLAPVSCAHRGRTVGVYGNAGGSSKRDGISFATTEHWREAMQIPWMTGKELKEAIPPVYTRYIGIRIP